MFKNYLFIYCFLIPTMVAQLILSGCTASRSISKGVGCMQYGDYDCAVEAFTDAAEASPDFAEAYYHRGNARAFQRKYPEAVADFSRAIELDADYAEAYFSRATTHIDAGDEDQGLSDLTQAIEIDPAFMNAYFVRGVLYKKKGEIKKALDDFNYMIKAEPRQAHLGYLHRGMLFKEQGEINLALTDFSKARSINPKDPTVYIECAEIRLGQDRYDEAIDQCRLALRLFPLSAAAYRIRAEAFMKKKDYDLALWDYSEAIGIDSTDANLYAGRGMAWKALDNVSAACKDFNQACRLMKNCGQAEFDDWMQNHCP